LGIELPIGDLNFPIGDSIGHQHLNRQPPNEIANRQFNRRSAIPIVNRQSINRQSAIGNPPSAG
jgi:hypothetical protein